MSFTNPAPGGTRTRIDQGVDYGNIRGNIGAVAKGIITNVYQTLSGFGTTVIEKLQGGQDVYYGLETGGGAPVVKAGEQVQAGQEIAPGLGTGGIEVGYWNPTTGRAVGAPEFTGSNQTSAGQRFAARIGSGGGPPNYLTQLWIDNGGPPQVANVAAAIAMAESGGQSVKQKGQPAATTGWGIWQITPGDPSLLDPNTNAKAAVAKYKAAGNSFSPWTTYNDGAYLSFLAGAATDTYGGTRPGGQNANATGDPTGVLKDYITLRDQPRAAPPGTKNPFKWWYASFTSNWDAISQR